jgi:hypothetical protein
MKKDKASGLTIPIVIAGLPDQSKHFDIDIKLYAAIAANEIKIERP